MGNDTGDDEAMLKAFEEFMLTGANPSLNDNNNNNSPHTASTEKRGKKKKKGRNRSNHGGSPSIVPSSATSVDSTAQPTATQRAVKTAEKLHKQSRRIFQGFCDAVRNEWMEIDDHLTDLVSSIENVRGRLPLETRALDRTAAENRAWEENNNNNNNDRGSPGVVVVSPRATTGPRSFLTEDDVRLALRHDLLQHERTMRSLRRSVSDLAEALRALGRRLDDAHRHRSFARDATRALDAASRDATLVVDHMDEIYSMLSRESYRKQALSLFLLRSADDSVATRSAAAGSGDADHHDAHRASATCAKEWPRDSGFACVDPRRLRFLLDQSDGDVGDR